MTFSEQFFMLLFCLSLSLLMAVLRFILGPSQPDRAIAFEVIIIHIVGLIALYSIATNQSFLIDVIIVVSVLGFLSTSAIAKYIGKEGKNP